MQKDKKTFIIIGVAVVIAALIVAYFAFFSNGTKPASTDPSASEGVSEQATDSLISEENDGADDSEEETEEEPETEETDDGITRYESGLYEVGKDIPAGEYAIEPTVQYGYMEVVSDLSGEYDSLITSAEYWGRHYVTVSDGQYLKFEGIAVAAEDAEPREPKNNTYRNGMYLVGKYIPAGDYTVTPDSDPDYKDLYYGVVSDSTGSEDSVIKEGYLMEDEKVDVSLKDGQYIKLWGCRITDR